MRKDRASLLVLTVALALPALAHAQSSAMGRAEQEVLQAETDRFAAMVKVDEPALEKLLSDDLTYTHSSGLFQNKAQFIADLHSGAIKYVSVAPSASDWKVRVLGNVAVVNGVAAVHVVDHGNDVSFRLRYTTVHRNRSGHWEMIAWEATKLP